MKVQVFINFHLKYIYFYTVLPQIDMFLFTILFILDYHLFIFHLIMNI